MSEVPCPHPECEPVKKVYWFLGHAIEVTICKCTATPIHIQPYFVHQGEHKPTNPYGALRFVRDVRRSSVGEKI